MHENSEHREPISLANSGWAEFVKDGKVTFVKEIQGNPVSLTLHDNKYIVTYKDKSSTVKTLNEVADLVKGFVR